LVINGDTFCEIDYEKCFLVAERVDLVVAAVQVDNVSRYGRLTVDISGNILGLNVKNNSGPGLINAGTYVVRVNDIQSYPESCFSFEGDFLTKFRGSMRVFPVFCDFVDIGVPEDYKYAVEKFS